MRYQVRGKWLVLEPTTKKFAKRLKDYVSELHVGDEIRLMYIPYTLALGESKEKVYTPDPDNACAFTRVVQFRKPGKKWAYAMGHMFKYSPGLDYCYVSGEYSVIHPEDTEEFFIRTLGKYAALNIKDPTPVNPNKSRFKPYEPRGIHVLSPAYVPDLLIRTKEDQASWPGK